MKSHSKSHINLIAYLLLLFSSPLFAQQQSSPCLEAKSVTIVILGSSTAAGTGPSSSDSTWVNRYRAHLQSINPNNQVINLAVGGYTTYRIMPDFFVSPIPNRPAVNTTHNISEAFTYNPDAIIVNLPSNDKQYPMFEQLQNFDSLYSYSNNNGVPMWITTTQPLGSVSWAQYQAQVADSILNTFGANAIDLWSPLVDIDSTVLNGYDSGDGVHLNNAGHGVIAQQIINADIASQVLDFDSTADYTVISITNQTRCSGEDVLYELIYGNIGGVDTTQPQFNFSHQTSGGSPTNYNTVLPTLNTCELDTVDFYVFAGNSGYYDFEASIHHVADTSTHNDSIAGQLYVYETPNVSALSDTACAGQSFTLGAVSNADSIFWYADTNNSQPFLNGNSFNLNNPTSDSTFYLLAANGPFFEMDSMMTTTTNSTSYNGCMFNLIADTDMIVDSMALIIYNTGFQDVNVYTRNGTFEGNQSNPAGWSLFTTASVNVSNINAFSVITIPAMQLIAGDTVGVYLELDNSSSNLRYNSGLSNPAVRNNGQLTIMTGSGVSHNFGAYYNYRDWNGKVFYHYGSNQTGMCHSDYTAVHAVFSDPQLSLPTHVTLIDTSTVTVHAGSGFSAYEWNDLSTDSVLVIDTTFVNTYGPYAMVFVTDEFGCTANDYSYIILQETDTISDTTSTGISVLRSGTIKLYPQPANEYLIIESNLFSDQKGSCSIYDVQGKVVQQSTLIENKQHVDVSKLPPGFYSIQIQFAEERITRKIVIQ